MKLQSLCTICQKPLQLKAECKLGESWYYREYKCGHAFVDSVGPNGASSSFAARNYKSCFGTKEAFPFQKDGVEFVFNANFNCLIADPMGLGKTIQALLAAREAKLEDGSRKFKHILIVVKAATTYQWFAETKEWYDPALMSVFMVSGTRGFVPPGFDAYVISMDTLSRYAKTEAGLALLKSLDISLVIVDECHSFKNPESARSQALVKFLQDISIGEITRDIEMVCNFCSRQSSLPPSLALEKTQEPVRWTEKATIKIDMRTSRQGQISYQHASKCPKCGTRTVTYQDRIVLDEREKSKGLIMLSGTPIENRAEEYFVTLNLLRPDLFTNLASFRRNWLVQDDKGKWSRIAPWKLERFKELTSSFIIRRKKTEVLDLPPFRRVFHKIEIEDPKFKSSYNSALDDLQKRVDDLAAQGKEINYFEMEANLMTLRRIVGTAKVPFAVEYVEEFLETVEDEKIAIGIHHDAVRDSLYFLLKQKGIECMKLSGEDSAEKKNDILKAFTNSKTCRVLVINMIAGGVGLNIQAANNTLILERQWNASKEEQFEGRFWRQGQTKPVLADYMLAAGIPTEDFFTTMVEEKRAICGESLDGWSLESDAAAVREIVLKSLNTRLK
jgi:SNF2 family DNA or RNA helicase